MAARFILTGFADEISPDLDQQVETLVRLGIKGLDLRSVGGVNVLDLSYDDLQLVHDKCTERGLVIQCVGSPVNKVPYDVMNRAAELEKLKKACRAANRLNVKRVRIFTPEVPEGEHEEYAGKVIEWMIEQRKLAEDHGVILIHENDAKFWGAYPENAKRLFQAIGNANFRAAFDFANTVLIGFDPMTDWFPWIVPHLDTIHIKDAVRATSKVVPAGEGEARIADTLKFLIDQDWSGPLTLEPHLQSAGAMGGFSGDQLFEVAANALKGVLAQVGGND